MRIFRSYCASYSSKHLHSFVPEDSTIKVLTRLCDQRGIKKKCECAVMWDQRRLSQTCECTVMCDGVRSQAKVWRRSYVGQEVPSKRVHGRSRVTSEVSGKGVNMESWTISENLVNLWMRSHVRLRRFQSKIEWAIMCDQRTHSKNLACITICDQRKCRKSVNTQSCVTSKDAVKRVYSKL